MPPAPALQHHPVHHPRHHPLSLFPRPSKSHGQGFHTTTLQRLPQPLHKYDCTAFARIIEHTCGLEGKVFLVGQAHRPPTERLASLSDFVIPGSSCGSIDTPPCLPSCTQHHPVCLQKSSKILKSPPCILKPLQDHFQGCTGGSCHPVCSTGHQTP